MTPNLLKCQRCGWVHFAISRMEAEEEVDRFNSFYYGLSDEEKAKYAGPASIEKYMRCLGCGGPHTGFVSAKDDDCPPGCTLNPILAEKMTQKIYFIDFEASSFHGYPIEWGWSSLDLEGNIDSGSYMIRPAGEWLDEEKDDDTLWSPAAENIHGISKTLLMEHGVNVPELCDLIDETYGTNRVYCRDINYDGAWREKLYDAAGRLPTWRIADIEELTYDYDKARLDWAYFQSGKGIDDPHRGRSDAKRLARYWWLIVSHQEGGAS